MEDRFGEVLIPTETVTEQRAGGKSRTRQKTSFPGYIFVEMEMSEEVWHLVKDTPKVTGFIGNQRPQEVTPPQIDDLRKSIVEGAVKPKPRVTLRGRRRDSCHRRRVRELLGHRRRGEARQAEAPREGLDLRPGDAGRARLQSGREEALRCQRMRRATCTTAEERHGEESRRSRQAPAPGRQGQPGAARRSGARPARHQHHGVLQGVQRQDAGERHDHPRRA